MKPHNPTTKTALQGVGFFGRAATSGSSLVLHEKHWTEIYSQVLHSLLHIYIYIILSYYFICHTTEKQIYMYIYIYIYIFSIIDILYIFLYYLIYYVYIDNTYRDTNHSKYVHINHLGITNNIFMRILLLLVGLFSSVYAPYLLFFTRGIQILCIQVHLSHAVNFLRF